MGDRSFRADLDAMDDVVLRLRATSAELEEMASRLDLRIAVLHEQWDGSAAAAHLAAQAHWSEGFADMRAALSDMRSVADTARDNYVRAAETNLTMWRRLG